MQMGILDKNKYHFIGIGGIGVSAIARMMHLQGKKVSGSDMSQSEITDDLQKLGIEICIGHDAQNIKDDIEAIIYTVAIPEDNPEMQEAKIKGLALASYPEALGELSKKMFTIAVSGTHGKTTTTAMIGHILRKADLDPTIVVGSKMLSDSEGGAENFVAGKSRYLVVEACEYKRSFLNLYPKILVITNIEADHLDYYKDLEDIKSAFKELEDRTLENGGKVIKEEGYKKVQTDFELLVPGRHNIIDAQAAIRAVEEVGVSNEKAKEYLKDFKGTWRRLEYKGEKDSAVFYDDYAHHPSEIKASLSALREKYPDRELVCVFEPHQELRTKILFDGFVESLQLADRVFIAPIFVNKESSDGSVTNKTLAEAVNKYVPTETVDNPKELQTKLEKINSNKSLCIGMLGAGKIYTWTKEILKQ